MRWGRPVGAAVSAAAAAAFGVILVHLFTTANPDVASSNRWAVGLVGSIFAFAAGLIMRLTARFQPASGPRSFAQVDGGWAPAERGAEGPRSVRRPTHAMFVLFGLMAVGFAYLAGLFAYIAVRSADQRNALLLMAAAFAVPAIGLALLAGHERGRDRLFDTGLSGTAVIEGMTQTGMWSNNNPVVELALRVTVPGHPAYEVRHRETVPAMLLGALTNSQTLSVRVDPGRPSRLVVDWSAV